MIKNFLQITFSIYASLVNTKILLFICDLIIHWDFLINLMAERVMCARHTLFYINDYACIVIVIINW